VVFGNVVLGGDKFVESQTEDNSGALVAKLKQTPGAISYLALSFKDDALLTLPIKLGPDVIDPTPENIASGKYPVWAYEHMYTNGPATGATKAFLDFVTGDDFQSHGLPAVKGFIPIILMKITKDKD
jgi:phosphate transport system substrate-binding protein